MKDQTSSEMVKKMFIFIALFLVVSYQIVARPTQKTTVSSPDKVIDRIIQSFVHTMFNTPIAQIPCTEGYLRYKPANGTDDGCRRIQNGYGR